MIQEAVKKEQDGSLLHYKIMLGIILAYMEYDPSDIVKVLNEMDKILASLE